MSTIADKLKALQEVYPPERIAQSRERLDAFWREPYSSYIPFTLRRRDVPAFLNHNNCELSLLSPEQVLMAQLDDRIFKADLPDDYIPSLITGNSPYYLSIAFGCRWERMPNGPLVSHPLIHSVEEIDELTIPEFGRCMNNPFTQTLERIDYFLEATGGTIPLVLPDPQGPMALATQLWDQEDFFVAMIENPLAVHQIMNLCTQAIISFHSYLFERFGRDHFVPIHCMPYLYRPEGSGLTLSEDLFGVLSPTQLEEFLIPYLNTISETLGPLVIHSCGDCREKFKTCRRIHNLAGVNFGQTHIADVSFDKVHGFRLISPNDWFNRQAIADYVQVLRREKISGWIQVHTIRGILDQEENTDHAQLLDLAHYLQDISAM